MSGNTRTLAAEDGQYYDYIELVNLSGADVDISGWYLSDDAADTMAWRIPDGTVVPAGGYLLFYASGNDAGMRTAATPRSWPPAPARPTNSPAERR